MLPGLHWLVVFCFVLPLKLLCFAFVLFVWVLRCFDLLLGCFTCWFGVLGSMGLGVYTDFDVCSCGCVCLWWDCVGVVVGGVFTVGVVMLYICVYLILGCCGGCVRVGVVCVCVVACSWVWWRVCVLCTCCCACVF